MSKITFKGKEYTGNGEAYVDNYGTNGDIVYYEHVTDAEGNKYKMMWYTTEEWDKSCELLNLETSLSDFKGCLQESEEIEKKEIEERIAELEAEGINSFYADDESNACDWENPAGIIEL